MSLLSTLRHVSGLPWLWCDKVGDVTRGLVGAIASDKRNGDPRLLEAMPWLSWKKVRYALLEGHVPLVQDRKS